MSREKGYLKRYLNIRRIFKKLQDVYYWRTEWNWDKKSLSPSHDREPLWRDSSSMVY